jgi:hypothetical protein
MYSPYRFLYWTFLFLVVLGAIPLCITFGWIVFAKTLGIISVVSLTIALWVWRLQTKNQYGIASRLELNTNDRFWLLKNVGMYTKLSSKDKTIFQHRVGLLMGKTLFRCSLSVAEPRDQALSFAAAVISHHWGEYGIDFSGLKEVVINEGNQHVSIISKEENSYSISLGYSMLLDTCKGFENKYSWHELLREEWDIQKRIPFDRRSPYWRNYAPSDIAV